MTSPAMDTWWILQIQESFFFYLVGFKSNKMVVVYYHNLSLESWGQVRHVNSDWVAATTATAQNLTVITKYSTGSFPSISGRSL